MGNDDAKRLILARRARFLAAAVASIGAVAACDTSPEPCLSPLVDAGRDDATPDANQSDAEPQPCLTPLPPDAGDDADAGPQPCLSPLPPDGGDGG